MTERAPSTLDAERLEADRQMDELFDKILDLGLKYYFAAYANGYRRRDFLR